MGLPAFCKCLLLLFFPPKAQKTNQSKKTEKKSECYINETRTTPSNMLNLDSMTPEE